MYRGWPHSQCPLVEYGFGEKQGQFLRWHGSPCKQKSEDWTSIPPTAQNAALLGTEC